MNTVKAVAFIFGGMILVKENKAVKKMYDNTKNKVRQKYEDWFPENLNTETREHCET